MASTPKNTTTTTSTEPSKIAQPYLKEQYATIDKAIKAGSPSYYPGSTVIDQSDATKAAQGSIINTATNGTPLIGNAQGAVDSVTTGAAFDPTGANALKAGTTYTNAATAGAQNLSDVFSGTNNPAVDMLKSTANGDYLNSNPYLADAIKNANDPLIQEYMSKVAPGIDSQFAAGGRNGSGAFAMTRNNSDKTFTDAIAKQTADIMSANYANERQNQIGAQNSIGGFYDSNSKNALSAVGMLGSLDQGQQDSRNSAAASLIDGQNAQANLQLQGAGMAGGLRELDYMDAEKLAGVGAQQDAYKDLLLQADIDRHNYNQNKDITNATNFVNVLNGGGYNSQTTTKPVYTNPMSTILGGLGSLASIFALCDRRKKANIKRCGTMIDGTALYEFTYKHDPSNQIYIGPMAQDVEVTRPHAVVEIDGIKHVHLGALAGDPAHV